MKVKLFVTAFILATAALIFVISAGSRQASPASITNLLYETEASDSAVARDRLIAAQHAARAPDLAAGAWINSDPLKLSALRGRVVLVDFWTFGCYNCRNTLPALKRWDIEYRERGLTILGVHSP
ncbi:MAG TPA: redoxin domain-containing protein, partial [Pyrinomonadaceae bacterium]|nr:redoxin domain-containing protein [Pyrinomonadaceae bacterium]